MVYSKKHYNLSLTIILSMKVEQDARTYFLKVTQKGPQLTCEWCFTCFRKVI